jgi:hypothetical protein
MMALLIHHHVPARDQEQTFVALEKKAARIRSRPLLLEGANARRSEQERVDQRILLSAKPRAVEATMIVERNSYHKPEYEFVGARLTGKAPSHLWNFSLRARHAPQPRRSGRRSGPAAGLSKGRRGAGRKQNRRPCFDGRRAEVARNARED